MFPKWVDVPQSSNYVNELRGHSQTGEYEAEPLNKYKSVTQCSIYFKVSHHTVM